MNLSELVELLGGDREVMIVKSVDVDKNGRIYAGTDHAHKGGIMLLVERKKGDLGPLQELQA